jgi:hypothetical protein
MIKDETEGRGNEHTDVKLNSLSAREDMICEELRVNLYGRQAKEE